MTEDTKRRIAIAQKKRHSARKYGVLTDTEKERLDQGWRAAIVERLQRDFGHVRWCKDKSITGYSTKLLEVGFHYTNYKIVSIERREYYTQRDVEAVRDMCLILMYCKETTTEMI